MRPIDISHMRLTNQQISIQAMVKPRDVVSWMGAMQAQDYAMARWAVGVRLSDANWSFVQRSIDKGEIIRTHLLRPTWHFVASRDIGWMLDLSAPQIRTVARPRWNELGITARDLKKSLDVFGKALEGGRHLTRDEMIDTLGRNRIDTQGQRASYILLSAEIEKVICSGPMVGKKNTYALFAERVKKQTTFTREEALAALGLRYFSSRGPATIQDFINWSGLPKTDAKKALELIQKKLLYEEVDGRQYWFKGNDSRWSADRNVYLLPAFDEFIIGYKDRSATLSRENKSAVISINGIFWPVIVDNGLVTGLWKRTVSGKGVQVDLDYFSGAGKKRGHKEDGLTAAAVERVRKFFSEGQ